MYRTSLSIKQNFNVLNLIRCGVYFVIPTSPATGILYITENNPEFISGQIRVRGRNNGSYPYNYLEMIDAVFGKEDNTIEVCSGMIRKYRYTSCYTVDINPETNPDLVDDAQILSSVPNNRFIRWRGDPPYNDKTATCDGANCHTVVCVNNNCQSSNSTSASKIIQNSTSP